MRVTFGCLLGLSIMSIIRHLVATTLVFIVFSDRLPAQSVTPEKVFVGEYTQLATFGFSNEDVAECKPWVQGPLWNQGVSTKFDWSWPPGRVWYQFRTPGVYRDSAVYSVLYPKGQCGSSSLYTLHVEVTVYSDSCIRLLPRTLSTSLVPDVVSGGWNGTIAQSYRNKIAIPTTFSNWRLELDSSRLPEIDVVLDAQRDSLIFAPFESRTIEHVLTIRRGPIYADATYHGAITVDVSNADGDSTYRTPIALHVSKPVWDPEFGFEADTIEMRSEAGNDVHDTITLRTNALTESHHLTELAGNFRASVPGLGVGANIAIPITASARTAGVYFERLKYVCALRDHNGDVRRDSDVVWLRLVVTGTDGEHVWKGTDGRFTNSRSVAVAPDHSVIAASNELYRSTDRGHSWEILSSPDSEYTLLGVTESGTLFVVGSDRLLMYTADRGLTWDTAKIGTQIYWYQYYFLPYEISRLMVTGNIAYAWGSKLYQSSPRGDLAYSEGAVRSVDQGKVWSGYEVAIPGRYLSNFGAVTSDSSGTLLAASGRTVVHELTRRHWDFETSITHLAVDGNGTFYALTRDGLFRSTDIGFTWERRGGVIDSANGLCAMPNGILYISTAHRGVYRSFDGGLEWESANRGLGTLRITGMDLQPGEPIYLATNRGGVYRSIELVPPYSTASVRTLEPPVLAVVRSNEQGHDIKLLEGASIGRVVDVLGREIKPNAPLEGYHFIPRTGSIVFVLVERGQDRQVLKLGR